MIAGLRSVDRPDFRGINLFTLSDWNLPMEAIGQQCFAAFDEVIRSTRSDPDATRIAVEGVTDSRLTVVNTAAEAALRAVPERWASAARFYTLLINASESGAPQIWSNLPHWSSIYIETGDGELERLDSNRTTDGLDWTRVTLGQDDFWVHVSLLRPIASLASSVETAQRFFRISSILEKPENQAAAFRWSVALKSPEDLLRAGVLL